MLLLAKTVRHHHRTAALLQNVRDFRLVQLAPEITLAVFNLRAQVVAQFRNDVIFLFSGQPESDRLQVSI
jgi:hypothetical protein